MRYIRYVVALLLSAQAAGEGSSRSEPRVPPEQSPVAGVNWQGQLLKATGAGAPNWRASSPAQARLGAEKAAQMDAFRNLLAQARGIRISGEKTVSDAMAKDEIRGRVEGVIKAYRVTAKRYFSDTGVELDVEVPLAALANALVDKDGDQQLAAPAPSDGARHYTGLVVDALGLPVKPALAPRLITESGMPVLALGIHSGEPHQSGAVPFYVPSVEEAKRLPQIGSEPLVVKASGARGSDLVLGPAAVDKLLHGADQGHLKTRAAIAALVPVSW